MTNLPPLVQRTRAEEPERDKPAEKRLSDETRMALKIAEIEKIMFGLPLNLAFGALATLAGRLVVATHGDEEKRRNNRIVFGNTVDTVIRMEEERVAAEAIIRRQIDDAVARQQAERPLEPINAKAIEIEVRAKARQKAKDHAH